MDLKLDQYTKLVELIGWVQEPNQLDERVSRLKYLDAKVPEFTLFIKDYFNEKYTFEKVLKYGEVVVRTVNPMDGYGYGVLSLSFVADELPMYSDASPWRDRIKHSKLTLALDEMNPDDAQVILSFMRGDLQMDKINLLVLSKAFPEEFPLGEV